MTDWTVLCEIFTAWHFVLNLNAKAYSARIEKSLCCSVLVALLLKILQLELDTSSSRTFFRSFMVSNKY